MKRLIILILILQIPADLLFAQNTFFHGPEFTVTSGSTYGSVRPRVVLTTGGVPLVMWSKTSGQIFVSRWNGSSFTAPSQVNPAGVNVYTSSSEGPSIEAKGDTVYITYFTNPTNASKIYVQASYDAGQTFQDTVRADNQGSRHPYTPDVAITSGGNPFIAFEVSTSTMANPEQFVCRSLDGGQSFTPEVSGTVNGIGQPCECCPPRIAVKDSMVYLVYRNNVSSIREMYLSVSSDYGASFPTVLRLDTNNWFLPGCPSQGADILLTPDSLLAVWMTEVNNETRIVMGKAHLSNLGIGGNQVVDHQMTGNLIQRNPTISGKGDTIAIAWEDNRSNGNFNCYTTFSTTGTNGLGDQIVYLSDSIVSITGNQVTPDVVYGNGCFHFVYQNAFSNSVIYRKSCPSALGLYEVDMGSPNLLFANPHSSVDFIYITAKGKFILKMFDLSGRELVIYSGINSEMIDLPVVNDGMYYLIVTDEAGRSVSKPLVIKK